ncbi:MAG TPA: hypothetical protein VIM89_23205 [Mucilaginibacter sp.]
MEASVKEYLYLEKLLEENKSRLESYNNNRDIFKTQICELESLMWQAKIDLNRAENYLILINPKAERVRVNLILTIKNILENIKTIREFGKYPSLNQNLALPGWIFWKILHSLQHIIENEGDFGASRSYLKGNYGAWNYKGLEYILANAVTTLSATRFNSLKDSIDFFTELAQGFILEYKKIIEKHYDSYGQIQ